MKSWSRKEDKEKREVTLRQVGDVQRPLGLSSECVIKARSLYRAEWEDNEVKGIAGRASLKSGG